MLYERTVTDTIAVWDSVEWFQKQGIEGVINEIGDAKRDRDFYKAISLSRPVGFDCVSLVYHLNVFSDLRKY